MVAERAIRTIKTRLQKYFTEKNTKKWIDVLDDFVDNYNHTPHRSIKMAPQAVSHENRDQVFNTLYPNIDVKVKPRLKIGDKCRILLEKEIFEKGYTKNWSNEIYEIINIYQKSGIVWYRIQDQFGNPIHKRKYYWELNLVQHVSNSSK